MLEDDDDELTGTIPKGGCPRKLRIFCTGCWKMMLMGAIPKGGCL